MRVITSTPLLIATAFAQGDLVALLQTQPDLSTLFELVALVPGLSDTLSQASNITIVAPTNRAFETLELGQPESDAVINRNVTSIAGLLANHVFQGYYPSESIGDVPTYAQTLLNASYFNDIQPFTNTTGGQYNGLVANGDEVNVLSGELTVSKVTEADIRLGDGIIIHKVDTVLKFGAIFLSITVRATGLYAMNEAVVNSGLNLSLGLTQPETTTRNESDVTIFIPNDIAFGNIGSVLQDADPAVLREVLEYHVIEDNIIFSPSLSNTSVQSLQGNNLDFTVFPDGSAFVNGAKIIFPNFILYNGVAHVIDGVLNPNAPPPERTAINPSAPAIDRVAFPGATSVPGLTFSPLSFTEDTSRLTTASLFATLQAVAPASATGTGPIGTTATTTASTTEPTVHTGGAAQMKAGIVGAGAAAVAAGVAIAQL